ncbi:MAG: pur operon repressor [Clostridia bacterium]|nr:pur operon repressor [Clostridia bacterium]MDD6040477.1 pur operon repressor [Clostridia bacterium]
MDRIKRNERLAALTKLLTASPNQLFTLSHFCEMFGAAKSTLSEDVDILCDVYKRFGLGRLDTVTGAAGGVRYRPYIEREQAVAFLEGLCRELQTPSRLLPGGFLYLSDILSMPDIVRQMGIIIAGQFYDEAPDFVLTMETKGIPVALMTAQSMGVPLVIARRSSKVYEGSAVNINYVSGSSGHIETMSLSRRAVVEGQRALIVDDFLKAGGTAKGMIDLMSEFNVQVVGTAFVMATAHNAKRVIHGEKALMVMDEPEGGKLSIRPAEWLL